jgi:hypothetical protein
MALDMNRPSGQKGRPEIDKRKEEPAKRAGVKEDGEEGQVCRWHPCLERRRSVGVARIVWHMASTRANQWLVVASMRRTERRIAIVFVSKRCVCLCVEMSRLPLCQSVVRKRVNPPRLHLCNREVCRVASRV